MNDIGNRPAHIRALDVALKAQRAHLNDVKNVWLDFEEKNGQVLADHALVLAEVEQARTDLRNIEQAYDTLRYSVPLDVTA